MKLSTKKLLLASIFTTLTSIANYVYANNLRLDCDSTCLVPQTITFPKINTTTTTQNADRITNGAICGASAGSVLPSAPSTFLCSNGAAGPVTTTTSDGETQYKWICSATNGSTSSCVADKREVGQCGTSNGQNLTSTPTNLCAGGAATGYSLTGNLYKWSCIGNYGAVASCTANYTSPDIDLLISTVCLVYEGLTATCKNRSSNPVNITWRYLETINGVNYGTISTKSTDLLNGLDAPSTKFIPYYGPSSSSRQNRYSKEYFYTISTIYMAYQL